MSEYGELIAEDAVRFERMLPGPIELVWSFLVESDKRARWLCAGETESRVGGNVEMHFHNASLSSEPDDTPPEKYKHGAARCRRGRPGGCRDVASTNVPTGKVVGGARHVFSSGDFGPAHVRSRELRNGSAHADDRSHDRAYG